MESLHAKVAIPRFDESVAPCFEYSATVAIFTIAGGRVVDQIDFSLQTKRFLDRIRLLKDQGVDTLICGGVQDRVEDIIRANGIRVISWVTGSVETLLSSFIQGRLEDGRRSQKSPGKPA